MSDKNGLQGVSLGERSAKLTGVQVFLRSVPRLPKKEMQNPDKNGGGMSREERAVLAAWNQAHQKELKCIAKKQRQDILASRKVQVDTAQTYPFPYAAKSTFSVMATRATLQSACSTPIEHVYTTDCVFSVPGNAVRVQERPKWISKMQSEIKEVPEFRPTDEEFKHPFSYIRSIAAEGAKFVSHPVDRFPDVGVSAVTSHLIVQVWGV